jgi:FkbM family methyltransferase
MNLKRRLASTSPGLARRLRWALEKRSDLTRVAIDELSQAGATVVDIGASDGVFAERFSRLVGRTGHVHAFEANPEDAGALASVQKRCPNVSVYMVGLSDHGGEAVLHVPVLQGTRRLGRASVVVPSSRAHVEHEHVTIDLRRLDDMLADTDNISVIKCDVEGHEHEVLAGAEQVMRRGNPALVIEIEQRHRQREIAETFALLRDSGYEGYGMRGARLVPLDEFDVERDQLRFLELLDETPDADAPADYVHKFLFSPAGRALPAGLKRRLLDHAQRS